MKSEPYDYPIQKLFILCSLKLLTWGLNPEFENFHKKGIILIASRLLLFCTRSAMPALAHLSCCIISGVLAPRVTCCFLCLHFQTHPTPVAWGVLHWDSGMHRKSGHSEFKKWVRWPNNGLLCGGGRASEDCRYSCFRMVISRQAGLCFPSCRLPKRVTVTYFPPKENMQISSKTLVKIP